MKADFVKSVVEESKNQSGLRKICKKESKRSKASKMAGDTEKMEIKAYLNKLQEMVPFLPNDKKMSKTEVITHVIDYIRELRVTLGLPPSCAETDVFHCDSDGMEVVDDVCPTPSPPTAVMMTMTMLRQSHDGSVCSPDSTAVSTASISSAPTPPTCPTVKQQPNRQPLGVVALNPSATTQTQSRPCEK